MSKSIRLVPDMVWIVYLHVCCVRTYLGWSSTNFFRYGTWGAKMVLNTGKSHMATVSPYLLREYWSSVFDGVILLRCGIDTNYLSPFVGIYRVFSLLYASLYALERPFSRVFPVFSPIFSGIRVFPGW